MCSFDGETLFDSGPCRFHVGGRELRHTLATPIDADGEALRADGRSGRRIKQTGTLAADTLAELAALGRAIENKLDGRSAALVDNTGESYENTVMLRFNPAASRRVGPRWCVDYAIEYLQVLP